jgi:hypothetical protein
VSMSPFVMVSFSSYASANSIDAINVKSSLKFCSNSVYHALSGVLLGSRLFYCFILRSLSWCLAQLLTLSHFINMRTSAVLIYGSLVMSFL